MSKIVACHPDNVAMLRQAAANAEELKRLDGIERAIVGAPPIAFTGMKILANDALPRFKTEFVPPSHRFVEYEKKDEAWLRYFGMGHDVETKERAFFLIDEQVLLAPHVVQRDIPIRTDWMAGLLRWDRMFHASPS